MCKVLVVEDTLTDREVLVQCVGINARPMDQGQRMSTLQRLRGK